MRFQVSPFPDDESMNERTLTSLLETSHSSSSEFDLFEEELTRRTEWVIQLRWLAAAGTFIAFLIGRYLFNLTLPDIHIIVLIAFILFYNAVCVRVNTFLKRRVKTLQMYRDYHRFAHLQIALDLITLATLLHFTGGIENPFFFYFVFHMILASILLRPIDSVLQATFAVFLVNFVIFGEAIGMLRHYPLGILPATNPIHTRYEYVLIFSGAISSTLLLGVFMATSVTIQLRKREQELNALTRRLQIQTRQLLEANRVLRELDARKSRFLRRVEHELRAPLSAVQAMLKVVAEGYVRTDAEKAKELIERAEKRTFDLLAMIGDLLHLSKLQDVSAPIKRARFDAVALLKDIYQHHAQSAIEEGVTIKGTFPVEPVYLEANEQLLDNVFVNIMSNAIKYTGSGGSVAVNVFSRDRNLILKVTDTGIGIPQEDIDKIFEEFHRAPNAIEKGLAGSGLGLSIVKQIVENYGGTIEVRSTWGKGSEFTVTLPLKIQ